MLSAPHPRAFAVTQPTVETPWRGDAWLAPHALVFFGVCGHARAHAHHPHQWLRRLDGQPLVMWLDGQRVEADQLFIPSRCPHAFEQPEQAVLALFAEPHAYAQAALAASLASEPPSTPEALLERLRQVQPPPLDRRLQRALETLLANPADAPAPTTLAALAGLSASQLQRLASAQLGISLQRLLLWQRLRLALRAVLGGGSLTVAAHAAGFADGAHLSRSVRRLLGIRADLSMGSVRLVD